MPRSIRRPAREPGGALKESVMFSNVITIVVYSLSFCLLFLVLSRNLYRRLPAFTVFVFSYVIRDLIAVFINYTPLVHTLTWIYSFWTWDIILTVMYLFVIAEIAKRFLRDYPSIWHSASRLLAVVTLALTSWTIYSAFRYFGHPSRFIMVGDQHLALTITILILLVMAIGAYYRLKLPPLYRLVLVGIGIYAAVQVVANQIQMQYHLGPNSIWDYLRRGSFTISVAVWIYAVWRWTGSPVRHAELIPQSKYDDLSPQVHSRLRDVIQKLATLAGQRS
jgi:hypothetical protein